MSRPKSLTWGFHIDSVEFTPGVIDNRESLGGSESACLGLARALQARGHRVHIFTTKLHADAPTRDRLIRDKIGAGQWSAHLGRSGSLFVNAATWGLMLSGKLVATHSEGGLSATLGRLLGKGGKDNDAAALDAARVLLGVSHFDNAERIRERHRALISQNHPDAGGSDAQAAAS